MSHFVAILFVVALGVSIPPTVAAQADAEAEDLRALRREIEQLHAGQDRLQKELQAIKGLLSRGRGRQRPEPPQFEPTMIDIGAEPFKGKADARVTLVDFTDYQ